MNTKLIHVISKYVAILFWIIVLCILFFAVFIKHNIWGFMPIYAYNLPQGFLGWMLCIAVLLSIISASTKIR